MRAHQQQHGLIRRPVATGFTGESAGYSISGRKCDRRLIILPDTMKTPSPL